MKSMQIFIAFLAIMSALISLARAEQSVEADGYVIHYSALNTDFLSPQVAKLYGITRSTNRGMLNVTVLKKHMGLESLPVKAKVTASAVNLSSQTKTLAPREVMDAGAIYYIAEFPVADKETLEFTLQVTPEDGSPHSVQFTQQFHTN